jgi:DNA-directed RNA polymerase specialized sigma24 family protein
VFVIDIFGDELSGRLALELLTFLLALEHPLQAEVVKLRYFAGITNEEVAQLLGISFSTAKNDWNFSCGWLFKEIQRK